MKAAVHGQTFGATKLSREWLRNSCGDIGRSIGSLEVKSIFINFALICQKAKKSASRDFKELQKMRSSASVVVPWPRKHVKAAREEGILGREGHEFSELEDITVETASLACSFEEAANPAERVILSLPMIIQAILINFTRVI